MPKSAGPDGLPSTGSTVAELQRRHIHARHIRYVGEELHRLEEVDAGILHDLDEVSTEYVDPRRDPRRWESSSLSGRGRPRPPQRRHMLAGVDRSTVKCWKAGTMAPRPSHIAAAATARLR